jgi:hypothetical protein
VLSEQQSIDDQIEWLDNSTLHYGLPRDGSELDSDIWSIRTDPSAVPALFIEHASSRRSSFSAASPLNPLNSA